MDKRTGIVAVALVAVLIGAAVAYFRSGPRVDARVAKALETQKKVAATMFDAKSKEERREAFTEMRKDMEQLDDDQRKEVFEQGMTHFARKMDERLEKYFELSPPERIKYLDKEIQRMEKMGREMRAEGGGGGKGGPRPGNMAAGRGDAKSRDDFRRNMLNKTTPDQRARMTEFMRDMQSRRQALGLPVFPIPF